MTGSITQLEILPWITTENKHASSQSYVDLL